MEQSVPKRRHIKFRRRVITQKKAYNKYHVLLGDITHKKSHEPVRGASAVPDSKHNIAQSGCRILLG